METIEHMAFCALLQHPEVAESLNIRPENFRSADIVKLVHEAQKIDFRDDEGGIPASDVFALAGIDPHEITPIRSEEQARLWMKNLQEFHTASDMDSKIHALWTKEYGENPGAERVEALREILRSAEKSVVVTDIPSLKEVTANFLDATERELMSGKSSSIYLGMKVIDKMLKGLRCGDVTLVASEGGAGKSTFVSSLARVAAKQGKSVFIASAEMSESQLGEREASILVEKDPSAQWSDISEVMIAREAVDNEYLSRTFIDTTWCITTGGLESKIKQLISTHGIDMVVIDHIDHFDFGPAVAQNEKLGRAILFLKGIAKMYQLPVIVIAHINREGEKEKATSLGGRGRKGRTTPNSTWLRGSTHLSQVPDNIIILIRDVANGSSFTEIWVIKARMGSTGCVNTVYDSAVGEFVETNRTEERLLDRDIHRYHAY